MIAHTWMHWKEPEQQETVKRGDATIALSSHVTSCSVWNKSSETCRSYPVWIGPASIAKLLYVQQSVVYWAYWPSGQLALIN